MVRRSFWLIKLLQCFLLHWMIVVFLVACLPTAVWKIIITEVNVHCASLQCHWRSTQPSVPQQFETKWISSFYSISLLSHFSVWFFTGWRRSWVCLSRLKTIISDVSFNSWGALIEWGLPSVLEGLWGAFYSQVVWFLAWGLCRLELPSEMFTCLLFLCLEEGVVSYVHIPNLLFVSVEWMCQLFEDAFLIQLNMRPILNMPPWCLVPYTWTVS